MDDMDKRYLLVFKHPSSGVRQRIMLAWIVSMILVAVASEAKVYLRWGAAGNIRRYVKGLGGKLAYEADLTVNGKNAGISVYGLPESNRSWGNSVRSISYNLGDTFASLTGVTLSGTPLLFHYQRQISEGRRQVSLFSLPRFPQSTEAFYVHDENADMHISVSRSHAEPSQVRNFYRGEMRAAGWHIPLSPNDASPEGMTVFIREQEVACVAIEQVDNRTETRITLLHKRLHIK
jgi:hypothetical protein